ncbi:MAG: molybdenum cofactor guanylyltransferase [Anaerolineae bacterium]|nr:molybdenum cofactor guanylyltransferase [Anaerolineae bacterium]
MIQTQNTSGIILAGGSSTRLGKDKTMIEVLGEPLIQRVARTLSALVDQVILVTNCPETLTFLNLPMVKDIYPGAGTLGGLHTGLDAIQTTYGLVVGCDMPFLNVDLLRYMISLCQDNGQMDSSGYDVIIPRIGNYLEPLHALYARSCRYAFEKHILSKQYRIRYAFEGMHIRYIQEREILEYDPQQRSFFNVNTPEDLEQMRALLAHPSAPDPQGHTPPD